MNEETALSTRDRMPPLEHSRMPPIAQRLVARTKRGFLFIQAEEILWIEAEGPYCLIRDVREVIRIRKSISEFERDLNPRHFVRIGRSVIVNIHQIRMLQPRRKGDYEVILRDGTVLSWSRTFRHNLDSVLLRMSTP